MNKSELIAEVALKAELTKKDADAAVNAVIDAITDSLKKGDKVQLVALAPSRSASAAPVPAVIPAPTRRSRSPLPRPLLLRLARP